MAQDKEGKQERSNKRDDEGTQDPAPKQDRSLSRLERRAKNRESKGEREAVIARQREEFRKRTRNKRIFNYTILAIVIIAIVYGVYVYSAGNADGQHDKLAQCLTEKGAVMYGTDWCPHCQEQKREFGTSFKYVTYVNCDLHQDVCDAHNVTGFPTWIFPAGPNAEGTQTLAFLADRAGCQQ